MLGDRKPGVIPRATSPERSRITRSALPPEPVRTSGNERMGRGELYEHYKRQGMLDVYFRMFPNG